jgi:hypothetical protein
MMVEMSVEATVEMKEEWTVEMKVIQMVAMKEWYLVDKMVDLKVD